MEMGRRPLGATMMDEQPDQIVYPTLYLNDGDAQAVPSDAGVGDERVFYGKVRISSISSSKDGSKGAELQILEMNIKDKDQPSPATRLYPTMSGE